VLPYLPVGEACREVGEPYFVFARVNHKTHIAILQINRIGLWLLAAVTPNLVIRASMLMLPQAWNVEPDSARGGEL